MRGFVKGLAFLMTVLAFGVLLVAAMRGEVASVILMLFAIAVNITIIKSLS